MTQAVLRKHSYFNQLYHYIDMTAGPGLYGNNGDEFKGSPLAFMEIAKGIGLRYRADFIEINEDNLNRLKRNIQAANSNGDGCHLHFYRDDYTEYLPKLLRNHNNKELGLFYVDPTGEMPDFDVLGIAARQRPKMEVLIHLSATNVKRQRQFTDMELADCLRAIGRSYWLIREPLGPHQWTFLMGSNSELLKQYKSIGFYRLESRDGQAVFSRLNFTHSHKERSRVMSMPVQFSFDGQMDPPPEVLHRGAKKWQSLYEALSKIKEFNIWYRFTFPDCEKAEVNRAQTATKNWASRWNTGVRFESRSSWTPNGNGEGGNGEGRMYLRMHRREVSA